MDKILVIGSGSWGTALVKILLENKNIQVTWGVRDTAMAEYINQKGVNPRYLRSVKMDMTRLHAVTSLKEAIAVHSHILLVTPSAFVADALADISPEELKNKHLISAIKGVEPNSLKVIGAYLNEKLGIDLNNFGVITGPCHAEEVAQEKLSYLTAASINTEFSARIQALFSCEYIIVSKSTDVMGTELGAVLKNVYAIAAGICHALGFGDNFLAVLVSNSIREMSSFIEKTYPDSNRNINDSAYLGDLLVTAYSQYSRNRTLGGMLGKGYSIKSALVEMEMVAEGYYATDCVYRMNAQYKVDMPILNFVYNVIYQQKEVGEEAAILSQKLT